MEQGVILFLKINIGSNSESSQPFLYQGDGKFLRLFKQGDNPFANGSIKPFDGKSVIIAGNFGENDLFYVSSIEEI